MKALHKAGAMQKSDERILGDGDFVEAVLSACEEAYERKTLLKAEGMDVEIIAQRVARIMDIAPEQVWASGKRSEIAKTRSLLCYWAVSELRASQVWLSKRLGLSQPSISLSVARGRELAIQNKDRTDNL